MFVTPGTMIVIRLAVIPVLFAIVLVGLSSSLSLSATSILFLSGLMLLVSYLLVAFSLHMVILAACLIISLPLMQ